jgi:hypothetical protein
MGDAWGERIYSSYSFTTSELDGVSGQRHALVALLPLGKGPPQYPLDRRLGRPRADLDVRIEEKPLPLLGIEH